MATVVFDKLAIESEEDLVFGECPRPLETRDGLVIGGGLVYPELNFTLPPMSLEDKTWPEARREYEHIVQTTLRRAAELEAPGVVLEFETLPPMTENPDWGVEIVEVLLKGMGEAREKHGLRSTLRMTPNDNREMERPPKMREGRNWDTMRELFDRSAAAGAELLSIESTGGKELHDDALLHGDIAQSIFALCVLGVRDMRFVWTEIADAASRHGAIAAGDTACAFGNTAMALAEQGMISRVFASVVRPVTAVRSLVAYECGAVGPGKDCGYENPILKAVTGFPMSMEGKSAACAHHSAMGNVSAAMCDLWSNESVTNVKLLSSHAPVVSMEQLIYDCRLMNQARSQGKGAALQLRDWLSDSDAALDPQAFVLTPAATMRFARILAAERDPYKAGVAIAKEAVSMMRDGHEEGRLKLRPSDARYLDLVDMQLEELPATESEFIDEMIPVVDHSKVNFADYDLG